MAQIKPPRYFMHNKAAKVTLMMLDFFFSFIFFQKKKDLPLPKKILLSHPGHIGDAVLMTSLLKPLKHHFPKIKIGVVVGSHSRMVVDGHPDIDWIHTVDHFKLNRSSGKRLLTHFKTRKKALKEIKEIGYDISVDCNFHFPSLSPLFWRARIPCRLGYKSAGFSPFLTHKYLWENINQSAAYFFLSLLKAIPTFIWDIALKPSLHIKHETLHLPKQSYVIVHMGSGNKIKEWPLKKWGEFLKKLEGEKIVFTGRGAKENKDILSLMKPGRINLCNQLSWDEWLSLIKNAKRVFGVDTSIGHISAAFDTPATLLFTGIYPARLWAPLSENIKVISHPMPCSPCFKGKGCKTMNCIRLANIK